MGNAARACSRVPAGPCPGDDEDIGATWSGSAIAASCGMVEISWPAAVEIGVGSSGDPGAMTRCATARSSMLNHYRKVREGERCGSLKLGQSIMRTVAVEKRDGVIR